MQTQSGEVEDSCSDCKTDFSVFRWKHPCRYCGKCFCDSCSPYKRPIPSKGHNMPVRVCKACFVQLAGNCADYQALTGIPSGDISKFIRSANVDLNGAVERQDVIRSVVQHCQKNLQESARAALRARQQSELYRQQAWETGSTTYSSNPLRENVTTHPNNGAPNGYPPARRHVSTSGYPGQFARSTTGYPGQQHGYPVSTRPGFGRGTPHGLQPSVYYTVNPQTGQPVMVRATSPMGFRPANLFPQPTAVPQGYHMYPNVPQQHQQQQHQPPQQEGVPIQRAPPQPPTPFDGLDSLSTSELQAIISRHNETDDDCENRAELLAKVKRVLALADIKMKERLSQTVSSSAEGNSSTNSESASSSNTVLSPTTPESSSDAVSNSTGASNSIVQNSPNAESDTSSATTNSAATTSSTISTETKSDEKVNGTTATATPTNIHDSDEEDLCVICLDAKISTVFIECGHMASCKICSTMLATCPLCRRPISRVIEVYHATKS